MGDIAGAHSTFGNSSPRYEVVMHPQSKFDTLRGKDGLAMVMDRSTELCVKTWLPIDEAIAMCKLLNESEKL